MTDGEKLIERRAGGITNLNLRRAFAIRGIAEVLHTRYELEAKKVGWKTQEDCQVDFDKLPEANKTVMLNVAEYLFDDIYPVIKTNQDLQAKLKKVREWNENNKPVYPIVDMVGEVKHMRYTTLREILGDAE